MGKKDGFKSLIKNFTVSTSLVVVFFSFTSFSYHTDEIDVEFNKQITPSEVEAIVDKELEEHDRNK